MKTIPGIILALALCAQAARATTSITVTAIAPQVDVTTGVVLDPTNFWTANQAAINAVVITNTEAIAYALRTNLIDRIDTVSSNLDDYATTQALAASSAALAGSISNVAGVATGLAATVSNLVDSTAVRLGRGAIATSNSIAIGATNAEGAGSNCVVVGTGLAFGSDIVLIGYGGCIGNESILIGGTPAAPGYALNGGIQIGTGVNNEDGSLQVRSYQLLDASGHIPVARGTGWSGRYTNSAGWVQVITNGWVLEVLTP